MVVHTLFVTHLSSYPMCQSVVDLGYVSVLQVGSVLTSLTRQFHCSKINYPMLSEFVPCNVYIQFECPIQKKLWVIMSIKSEHIDLDAIQILSIEIGWISRFIMTVVLWRGILNLGCFTFSLQFGQGLSQGASSLAMISARVGQDSSEIDSDLLDSSSKYGYHYGLACNVRVLNATCK